jgi:hypothetical protein
VIGHSMVTVPCPGRPACPDGLFGVDGHQHFRRAVVRVQRVVPGCWEALCPCCTENPVMGPVVAQVGSWARAMARACEHLAAVHRVLTSNDPQPPAGTVVRDDAGMVWVNTGVYPCAWMDADCRYADVESWTKVAGNYGPVTVLEWGGSDEGV